MSNIYGKCGDIPPEFQSQIDSAISLTDETIREIGTVLADTIGAVTVNVDDAAGIGVNVVNLIRREVATQVDTAMRNATIARDNANSAINSQFTHQITETNINNGLLGLPTLEDANGTSEDWRDRIRREKQRYLPQPVDPDKPFTSPGFPSTPPSPPGVDGGNPGDSVGPEQPGVRNPGVPWPSPVSPSPIFTPPVSDGTSPGTAPECPTTPPVEVIRYVPIPGPCVDPERNGDIPGDSGGNPVTPVPPGLNPSPPQVGTPGLLTPNPAAGQCPAPVVQCPPAQLVVNPQLNAVQLVLPPEVFSLIASLVGALEKLCACLQPRVDSKNLTDVMFAMKDANVAKEIKDANPHLYSQIADAQTIPDAVDILNRELFSQGNE